LRRVLHEKTGNHNDRGKGKVTVWEQRTPQSQKREKERILERGLVLAKKGKERGRSGEPKPGR